MFDIKKALRPNILSLTPYRCARDDYSEGILLDANENSLGTVVKTSADKGIADVAIELQLERYPDPHQVQFKTKYAKFRDPSGKLSHSNVFCGVGSDEVIDLIIRIFCSPGKEKILICPATYGMYGVCAHINDVETVKVPLLLPNFQLDTKNIIKHITEDKSIKVLFLCSPGNPTGTLLRLQDIKKILDVSGFNGVVVVDEAYIDFAIHDVANRPTGSVDNTIRKLPENSDHVSAVHLIQTYPNLIVSQTLSKSFGLAGIRFGVALANEEIIDYLSRTKAPYNISSTTSLIACDAISDSGIASMKQSVKVLHSNKSELHRMLISGQVPLFNAILGGSHANFLVVQFGIPSQSDLTKLKESVSDTSNFQRTNKELIGKLNPDNTLSEWIYSTLAEKRGIVVRFRGKEAGCNGCLRITIGTEEENTKLVTNIMELTKSYICK